MSRWQRVGRWAISPWGQRTIVGLCMFPLAELSVWTAGWMAFDWSKPPIIVCIIGFNAFVALLLWWANRRRVARLRAAADHMVKTAREAING